jgi:non-ribosomal peptide synthetase component F
MTKTPWLRAIIDRLMFDWRDREPYTFSHPARIRIVTAAHADTRKKMTGSSMSGQPWEKYYPAGLSWQDPLPPPFSLCGILKTSSERWPKRTAIEFYGAEFSYRVLFGLAARASKGLQQIGVGPDVNVALHLPNTPHFVTCFFGTLLAGGRVVNCNPAAGLDELRSQLRDSSAKVLVTADWLPSFPELGNLDETNSLEAIVRCRLTDFLAPELAEYLVKSSSQPKPSLM